MMKKRFWKWLGKTFVFLTTLALAFGLMALSGGYIAVAGFLYMRGGRDFRIDADHVPIWPEAFPAIDIYGRAAPLYLAGGIVAFLIGIPLVLALLEQIYLRISRSAGSSGDQSIS